MTHRLAGFILLVTLLWTAPALAWSDVYSWTASSGATSYKVESSIDNGVTWVLAGSPTTPTFTLTLTSTALTLVRISACNANGCATRSVSGFYHNEAWAPPLVPTNLTITP